MTTTQSSLDLNFDPWHDDNFENPIPAYNLLREQDPIHWNEGRGLWFVSRYDDVMNLLKDRVNFTAGKFQAERPHMERSKSVVYRKFTGGTMLTNEVPDHTRLRRPTVPNFSPKGVHNLQARVERLADALLDRIGEREEWDVIEDFSYPLPVLVMAAVLGIDDEDERELLEVVRADNALLAIDPRASQDTLDHYALMGKDMIAYIERLVARRRTKPMGDDLLSALFAAEKAGTYTPEELLATVHLMLEAGHVTTVNMIGNGLNLLLEDPTLIRRLQAKPDLNPLAVEECLRLDGPVHFAGRVATRDVDFKGHAMREGDAVIAMFAAANRDPRQYADPDSFVMDRSPNQPTNFGAGIHHCLGANLARMESVVAFQRILARYPNLAQARPGKRQRTFELRGFKDLPVLSGN